MSKARLLVVEDDIDIGNMLKIYFSGMEYDVDVAVRGRDALDKVHQILPHLVMLDIMLPDIDGFEVCRNLRTNMRTSHIPVIFLTQKDERADKLQGLELGADDYITKPFDIEELKLRVQGAIRRSEREALTDPSSGLPAGRLIEEQLRRIIREKGWALLHIYPNNFESFQDMYGFVAGDDVLRFIAMLLGEVMDELGTTSDFIGHTGRNFVIITVDRQASKIKSRLKKRFNEEVQTHYNFLDRQQGFVRTQTLHGKTIKVRFMTMSVGIASPREQAFADIREITEFAAASLFEDQIRHIIKKKSWAYLHLQVEHFEAYQEVYGVSESNKVIWLIGKMIREATNELRQVGSYIGHPAIDKFVIILPEKIARQVRENLKARFNIEVISHYHYIHTVHGYIRTKDRKKHPFMRLAVGMVSAASHSFTDIRKVAELAEYACTQDK
jgi:CheY-like chemotaxis protein